MKRELKVQEMRLQDAARRRFLKLQQDQREMELRRLEDEIERKVCQLCLLQALPFSSRHKHLQTVSPCQCPPPMHAKTAPPFSTPLFLYQEMSEFTDFACHGEHQL